MGSKTGTPRFSKIIDLRSLSTAQGSKTHQRFGVEPVEKGHSPSSRCARCQLKVLHFTVSNPRSSSGENFLGLSGISRPAGAVQLITL